MQVKTFGMCSYLFDGTGMVHSAIAGDVKMITRGAEAVRFVAFVELFMALCDAALSHFHLIYRNKRVYKYTFTESALFVSGVKVSSNESRR